MTRPNTHRLTIGRLAKRADVGIDTIRFYEKRGLLPAPARTGGGYRIYTEDTVSRLQFIKRAKVLGFSLEEIQSLLKLQDSGGRKSAVKKLTTHKLQQIDRKIADLSRMREVLAELDGECTGAGTVDGCPIIEALSSEAD
jgi:Hg(II)-responsive transcriptional regulator